MRPARYQIQAIAIASLSFAAASAGCVASSSAVPALDLQSLERWREQILPQSSELAWAQIPWRPSFHEGLADARLQRRPLLLWTMNGHPLGCT